MESAFDKLLSFASSIGGIIEMNFCKDEYMNIRIEVDGTTYNMFLKKEEENCG